jgi:hypothetical protein
MFTFLTDGHDALAGAPITPFLTFFVYVWGCGLPKHLSHERFVPRPPPFTECSASR